MDEEILDVLNVGKQRPFGYSDAEEQRQLVRERLAVRSIDQEFADRLEKAIETHKEVLRRLAET